MEDHRLQQFMTRAEDDLLLLESLIGSSEKLYVWCYDREGKYIATSCPERERSVFEQAFRVLGCTEKLISYAADSSRSLPCIIGSPIGMQWALTYEAGRDRALVFAVGPVFYTQPDEVQLRTGLRPFTHILENARWASELIRLLQELPVMSFAIFSRYVMLVHNILTGQQLGPEALLMDESTLPQDWSQPPADAKPSLSGRAPAHYRGRTPTSDEAGGGNHGRTPACSREQLQPSAERDRNKVYQAEQALLQMVRDGNIINYGWIFQRSASLSSGVPVQGKNPLRQQKTSIIVFITLVSRAAMEGGLSPEIAYPLGDSYIQTVEDCRDSGELNALSHAMYHDFIYRVHHLRANPDYSPAIQRCCDYIELSLNRRIRTADLAALVGYSEYYLTEKFKNETGQSVSSYIRSVKVERARILLRTTKLSIREISDQLAFNTVNYFIKCFRDVEGCTPAQYRNESGGQVR